MINIFYDPNYAKRSKTLFTFKFKESSLINLIIDVAHFLNVSVSERIIVNGPHKLMNNLIKSYRGKRNISFNKVKYEKSYIVQFDHFGERILNQLISKKISDQKILIGPLYTLDHLTRLSQYTKDHNFIKIVAASKASYKIITEQLDIDIPKSKVTILPMGVTSQNKLNFSSRTKRNEKVLLYFKNRKNEELENVIRLLTNLGITYDLFQYGKYDNKKLKKASYNYSFGIVLTTTESQGFAIQEMLSCNLPLLVWNKHEAFYEGVEVKGTSVPYFDERCGLVVDSLEELKSKLKLFTNNNEKFQPVEYIQDNLTYEKFRSNLMSEFDNF